MKKHNTTSQALIETEALKSKYGAELKLSWQKFVFPIDEGTEYALTLLGIRVISFGTEIEWIPSKQKPAISNINKLDTTLTGLPLFEIETLHSKYGCSLELSWRRLLFSWRDSTQYVHQLLNIRVISTGSEINWTPKE